MVSKSLFLAVLLATTITATAQAAVVIGTPCRFIGDTSVTGDRESYAICLKQKDGTGYVWKGMNSETDSETSNKGFLCGFATAYCAGGCVGDILSQCLGQDPIKPVYGPQGHVVINFTTNCPKGFSAKSFPLSSRATPNAALPLMPTAGGEMQEPSTSSGGAPVSIQLGFFCVKD